jgi:hypothetical protein
MTGKHKADTDRVNFLTSEIQRLEMSINALCKQRAGRIAWNEDDTVNEAWCCVCGKFRVFPDQGEDTCHQCTKEI